MSASRRFETSKRSQRMSAWGRSTPFAYRFRTSAKCAKETTGVDVNRTSGSWPWTSWLSGKRPAPGRPGIVATSGHSLTLDKVTDWIASLSPDQPDVRSARRKGALW